MNVRDKTQKLIDKTAEMRGFCARWIMPLTTPFFTIFNYFSLTHPKERLNPWGIAFFIVSVVYFFFGLGFAIYMMVKPSKTH